MKPKILSAGIIPFIRDQREPRFLLLRSFKYWDFPKGVVEKNEEPLKSALRELKEETGIAEASFPYGKDFIETEPYAGGKVARYYLAEVTTEKVVMGINPELGKAEHQEHRWVTAKEASTLLGERVGNVIQWAVEQMNQGN